MFSEEKLLFCFIFWGKAYFNSSTRQTSLETLKKSIMLGRIAELEDKGIQALYPAMPIAVTFTRSPNFPGYVLSCHVKRAWAWDIILKILFGSHNLLSASRKLYASPYLIYVIFWMEQIRSRAGLVLNYWSLCPCLAVDQELGLS